MIKKIKVRNYYIKSNKIKFPKRYKLFVCDTETIKGEPFTLQFYDGKTVEIFYVNKNNVLDKFLNYLFQKGLSKTSNVVFFHNIDYDLSVILYKYHKKFLGRKNIKIVYKDFFITFVYSNTSFCVIKKKNKRFICIDSFRFVQTSLEKFGELIKAKVQKLEKPSFLGERKPKTRKERLYFEQYARNDVLLLWEIANWILNLHKEYNVYLTYSNANLSERIFRHYYLKPYMNFELPPKNWIEPCVLSYHGGKNGFYLDRNQGIYLLRNGCELDIISAYPYALSQLPNFASGVYKEVDKVVDDYEGVYIVDGYCLNDKYPVIFTHDFKVIPYGQKIENLCITSYELKEALRTNEIEIKKIKGLVYIPDNKFNNPLKEFVNDFFVRKEQAKNIDERTFYKIILNSLYGKFIQAIDYEDGINYLLTEKGVIELEKEFTAGNCFHPMIATLTTGFVRVMIHQLEHKFNAVHTSTDSIICKYNKNIEKCCNDKLGGLELKIKGDCYLIRNKLYVWLVNGKIEKYALHGFLGSPELLLNLIKTKTYKYKVRKMIKVREAERLKKIKLTKLAFNEIERQLNDVNFNQIIEI